MQVPFFWPQPPQAPRPGGHLPGRRRLHGSAARLGPPLMPAGWHGMRARPSASACQRRPGRFVPRALQPSASGRARHPARRGPVWHAPRPAAPGLVSSAAQALRRACRRRHPLSRPCQPERRPCLSGTPDRPSSPPAPCPARHAGAPPARMLKLQRLAGLGWPLRALPFSPGRSLALAPAPALTRSASLAKSATSGASPCPAARQPRRRPGWHGLAFSSGLQPCGAPCWPCPAPLRQPGLRCRLPAAPAPCRGHGHPPARRRPG